MLSQAQRNVVEAENCDNNVHPRQGDKELGSPEVL